MGRDWIVLCLDTLILDLEADGDGAFKLRSLGCNVHEKRQLSSDLKDSFADPGRDSMFK